MFNFDEIFVYLISQSICNSSFTGTPIQNNLTELWALLKWLEVEPYASHRQLYKRQIEHAVKHGHPNGLQRLQTLIQAICLRRTKSDQVCAHNHFSSDSDNLTPKFQSC